MASVVESMVVDDKQLPEKPVDREKVFEIHVNLQPTVPNLNRHNFVYILIHLIFAHCLFVCVILATMKFGY